MNSTAWNKTENDMHATQSLPTIAKVRFQTWWIQMKKSASRGAIQTSVAIR